jgi:hypothetical protein
VLALAVAFSILTRAASFGRSVVIFWAAPASAFHGALATAARSIHVSAASLIGWGSLAIGCLLAAAVWRAPPLATLITTGAAVVALGVAETAYVFEHFAVPFTTRARTLDGVRPDWIDAVVPTSQSVALVPNPILSPNVWWDAEFWNRRVDRVLRLPGRTTYTPFPYTRLSVDTRTGEAHGLRPARYVLLAAAENRVHFFHARTLASAQSLRLVRVGGPARVDWSTSGEYPDGWSRPGRPVSLRFFPVDGAGLRQVRLTLSAPPARAGRIRFVVREGRVSASGRLSPGRVQQLSFALCVPVPGPATATVLSRTGVQIADGRVVGVRVDRIRAARTGRPCHAVRAQRAT